MDVFETFPELKEIFENCIEELNDIIDQQDINIHDINEVCLICNEDDVNDDMLCILQIKLEEDLDLPVSIVPLTMLSSSEELIIEPGCFIPTLSVEESGCLYY